MSGTWQVGRSSCLQVASCQVLGGTGDHELSSWLEVGSDFWWTLFLHTLYLSLPVIKKICVCQCLSCVLYIGSTWVPIRYPGLQFTCNIRSHITFGGHTAFCRMHAYCKLWTDHKLVAVNCVVQCALCTGQPRAGSVCKSQVRYEQWVSVPRFNDVTWSDQICW